MTQFSSTLRVALSFVMNFGQGRRATRRKAQLDDFMRTSVWMFARLRRTGWTVRSPVMTEMLVLSEERIMLRSVVPSGSISWLKVRLGVKGKDRNKPLPAFPMWRYQSSTHCTHESTVPCHDNVKRDKSQPGWQKVGSRTSTQRTQGRCGRKGELALLWRVR